MRRVIGLFQAIGREMGINLRRDEVGMPKQFLDTAQVRSGIEQMRRVAVPEFMRAEMRIQTSQGQILFQPKLQ